MSAPADTGRLTFLYSCGCVINAASLRLLPAECPEHPGAGRAKQMARQIAERPYDRSHYDLTIPGWMTQDELEWLYDQATRMTSIVEIGCYQGRSSYALLQGLAGRGLLYAVDPWLDIMHDGSDNYRAYLSNLTGRSPELSLLSLLPMRMTSWLDIMHDGSDNYRAYLSNLTGRSPELSLLSLLPMRMTSRRAAQVIYPGARDMVFIDRDHTERGVTEDIDLWLPRARRLLCGHDFGDPAWPAVEKVVRAKFPGRWTNPVGAIWAVTL